MQQNIRTIFPFKASRTTRLICLAIAFFIGLCFTSLITTTVPADNRAALLFQSAVQSVVAFILPAWVAFKAFYISPEKIFGISDGYPVRSLRYPPHDGTRHSVPQRGNRIQRIHQFPSLSQSAFREWEATAGAYTERMLDTTTVGGTSFRRAGDRCAYRHSRRNLFRGALQKMLLGPGVNRHGAVWLAALVFSIMHFQPFGFIPRLLLGAFFGYLYMERLHMAFSNSPCFQQQSGGHIHNGWHIAAPTYPSMNIAELRKTGHYGWLSSRLPCPSV